MAHLTLLPPDDPDDDEAVVVFDVFNSSLKFDFITPGFGVLRCCRSKELFSSEMDGNGRKMTLEMTTILMYTLRKCYSSLKYSNESNYTPALLIMKSISLGSRRFLGNPYAGISVSSSSSSSSSSSEIYLFFFEYL